MTAVWNNAFPMCPTNESRLHRLFCNSHWFNPEGYFSVRRGKTLLGWAHIRKKTREGTVGIIDVFALMADSLQSEIEKVLFQEIMI